MQEVDTGLVPKPGASLASGTKRTRLGLHEVTAKIGEMGEDTW
jgi:hypothetical protein